MYANFFAKLCRATVVRVSRICRLEILANLQCKNLATHVQMSYDSRATILRKHANTSRLHASDSMKIKLSDNQANVVRHSHSRDATVFRMKMKQSYIRRNVVRHSHEYLVTVVRQSRDYRAKVARYNFKS